MADLVAKISLEGAEQVASGLQGVSDNVARTSGNVKAAGAAMAAFGGAILGAFAGGIATAAGFEQQMSAVGAVTDATGAQLDQMRDLALQLGKDTSFSASEAAAGLEELGKAGVSVTDIMGGAAQGALDLAAAAGTSVPEAATVMSNALNTFSLSGDQAAHVADVFAAAANKSATDVHGLALGLQQSGTVAAQFGLSLEDTVGALAMFAQHGLEGADAGTSFKTMLMSMLTPMGRGADEIQRLGLNFRDANGNFVGLAGAADELHRALDPLPKDQRDAALAAIFGTDALRAASILYGEGSKGVTDYRTAVDDLGAAHRAAAARLDNFKGSLEQLRGSLETAGIVIGSLLLPPLRVLVDALTAVVNAFLGLPAPVQAVLAALAGVVGVVASAAGAWILLGGRVKEVIAGFRLLAPVAASFGASLLPIVGIAAAVGAALYALWHFNLFGFRDALQKVGAAVKTGIKTFQALRKAGVNPVTAAFAALDATVRGVFGANSGVAKATTAIAGVVGYLMDVATGSDHARDALDRLTGPTRQIALGLGLVVDAGRDFLRVLGRDGIEGALLFLPQTLINVGGGLRVLSEGLKDIPVVGGLAADAVDGLGKVLQRVGGEAQKFADDYTAARKRGLDPFHAAVEASAISLNRFLEHHDRVRGAVEAIVPPLIEATTKIVDYGKGILVHAVPAVQDLGRAIGKFLHGDFGGGFRELGDAAKQGALALRDAVAPLGGLIADAFGRIDWGGVAGTLRDGVRSAFDAIGPIAGWALKLGKAAISLAADFWDDLSPTIGKAWDAVKSAAKTLTGYALKVGGWAWETVDNLADFVWGKVGAAWDALKTGAKVLAGYTLRVGGWVWEATENLADFVWGKVETAWGAVKAGAKTLTGYALRVGGWAWETVENLADFVWGKIETAWQAIAPAGPVLAGYVVRAGGWTWETAENLADFVWGKIGAAWDALKGAGPALGGYVVRAGAWAWEAVENLADFVWGKISAAWDAIKGAGPTLGGYILAVGGWVWNAVENLADFVWAKVGAAWDAIKTAGPVLGGYLLRLGAWVVETADNLYDAVKGWVATAWDAIKTVGSDLPGYTLKLTDWAVQAATSVKDAVQNKINEGKPYSGDAGDVDVKMNPKAKTDDQGQDGKKGGFAGLVQEVLDGVKAAFAFANTNPLDIPLSFDINIQQSVAKVTADAVEAVGTLTAKIVVGFGFLVYKLAEVTTNIIGMGARFAADVAIGVITGFVVGVGRLIGDLIDQIGKLASKFGDAFDAATTFIDKLGGWQVVVPPELEALAKGIEAVAAAYEHAGSAWEKAKGAFGFVVDQIAKMPLLDAGGPTGVKSGDNKEQQQPTFDVATFITNMGTAGTQAGQAFVTNMNTALSGLNGVWNAVIGGTAGYLTTFTTQLGTAGTDSGTGFVTNLTAALTTLNGVWDSVIGGSAGYLQTFLVQLQTAGTSSGTGFVTNLTTALNAVNGVWNSVIGGTAGYLTTFAAQLGAAATAAGTGFVTNLRAALTAANAALTAFVSQAAASLAAWVSNMATFGQTGGQAFTNGLGPGLTAATTALASFIGNAASFLAGWVSNMATFGESGGTAFANGLGPGLAAALGAASSTAAAIDSLMGGLASNLAADGQAAGDGFAAGLGGGLTDALGTASAIAAEIASVLSIDLYGAGANAGSSFAAGLADQAGAAYAAAASIANAATAGAQSALGIASPSKVFRAIADHTLDGFLGPFAERMPEVVAAVQRLVAAIQSPFAGLGAAIADLARAIVADARQAVRAAASVAAAAAGGGLGSSSSSSTALAAITASAQSRAPAGSTGTTVNVSVGGVTVQGSAATGASNEQLVDAALPVLRERILAELNRARGFGAASALGVA